jgi:transmembrane sensor
VDVEAALRQVTARRDAAPAEPAEHARPTPRPGVLELRPAPQWRAGALRAAAVIAVLAGGATLWRQKRDDSTVTPATVAARYTTAVGERDSLRLPDGSRVVLGPGSSLETVAGFGGAARVVHLRGEAYFEVRHDAARPFTVHTATATVEDLGTAFAVRSGADGRVTVAVTEGSVRLQRPVGARSGAATDSGLVLRAGDRGALAAGGHPVAERGAAGPVDLAWTEGRLVFEDASAADVAAALRRWYGVELRFADAALAERHLTASFRDEPLADVLRVVALALGASMERRGDTVLVRSAPPGAP